MHVVNDLLDLTRTERGNDLFLSDPFNLSATIDEAIAVHKGEAERQGLTMEVMENPSGTPTTLLGDRAKIKTIITNVLGNAVQHTETGGIMVEWGELADAVSLSALREKSSAEADCALRRTSRTPLTRSRIPFASAFPCESPFSDCEVLY